MKEKEEIEKLAIEYCKSIKNTCEDGDVFSGFIAGYKKCQQESADRLKSIIETLLKIRDCKDYGNNSSTLARELIETINK